MHLALLQSSFNKPSPSTSTYAVDALAPRTDSPMLEEPRIAGDIPLATKGLPHGLPIEHHSSGFTAVNGDVNRLPPIIETQSPWRPHHGRNSPGENITVSTSLPNSGWRPDVREVTVSDERSKYAGEGTNKRKQSDLEADDQQALEGDDSRGEPTKRRHVSSMNIDSAIDLTSPDTEVERRPNAPGRSSREPSPVRNRGPLPPSSKVSAELHKSAMQFTQQVEPVAVEHTSPSNDDVESVDAQGPQGDQPQDDVGDGKKRKFANRTKTGCITCRKRKKKCDERKPTCLNCERGTFNCEGYGQKNSVGEIIRPGQHRPAQLQPSVKPYAEPRHHPQQPSWPPPQPDSTGSSYSHWAGVKPPTPSEELARLGHKDPYHSHPWHPSDIPPPPLHHALPSHHGPPAQHAPPMSGPYYHERTPSQYSQLPPPPQAIPPSIYHHPTNRQMSIHGPLPPPPPPPDLWPPHPPNFNPYRPSHGPSGFVYPAHSSANGGVGNSNYPPKYPVEKNKMLRGEPYSHYKDEQLLNERKSCMEAVDRYNEALRPEKRSTQEEQIEYMMKILKPQRRQSNQDPSQVLWGPEGDTGSHTVIEVPFKCDYGYHIHIGKETIVSADCYFQDGGGIHIGDRVIIGPRVMLSTITAPLGWERRKGSEGKLEAGSIWIGDDAYIGAGAIIQPFVHIGKGAVVGAGSVVAEDVADYTEVAGNPAIFLRRMNAQTNDHHKPSLDQQRERAFKKMEEYANNGFTHSPRSI